MLLMLDFTLNVKSEDHKAIIITQWQIRDLL